MAEHPVVIDESTIAAAFDAVAAAVAAEAPAAPQGAAVTGTDPAPEGSPAPVDPDAWRNEARLAASILAHKVCPNWEVPPDIQQQWADALAECANSIMPGGLANVAAWGPWGKLLFASFTWGMCGFSTETFSFKPLAPPEPERLPPVPGARPAPQPRAFSTNA